jgi:hypothetical protein
MNDTTFARVGSCPKCKADIYYSHPYGICITCKAELPEEIVNKLSITYPKSRHFKKKVPWSISSAYIVGVLFPTFLVFLLVVIIIIKAGSSVKSGGDLGVATLFVMAPFYLIFFFMFQHYALLFRKYDIVFIWAVVIIGTINIFLSLLGGPILARIAGQLWSSIQHGP